MVEQTGKEEMTLLITAGYGHAAPIKAWFSLRFDHFNNDLNDAAFINVVMNYGCDRSFAVKAASLLMISGRYDCCVQYGWINRRFNELWSQLHAVGVMIIVDDGYFPPFKPL